VVNLLDNALKFTPAGGRIRLTARRDGDAVEIAVTDEGPGMPEDDRRRAGDRFFRADAARSTPGSGLGLSLVRAVATLHGGALLLGDAQPDAPMPGLRAAIRLPVA
jgi:hypothetical protein